MKLHPGLAVIYHGGWGPNAYTMRGVIIGPTAIFCWDKMAEYVSPDLWQVRLETGSYISGYIEQFEPVGDSD